MAGSSSPLVKSYLTQAECSIKYGDECKIRFPVDYDTESSVAHDQYKRLHGEYAVVVKLNKETVDIRMTTGSSARDVITNVNPMNLVFLGPFQKILAEAEEPHFF